MVGEQLSWLYPDGTVYVPPVSEHETRDNWCRYPEVDVDDIIKHVAFTMSGVVTDCSCKWKGAVAPGTYEDCLCNNAKI